MLRGIVRLVAWIAVFAYPAWEVGVGLRLFPCGIKGNISRNGDHIYHVPGGEFYWRTRVNLFRGERWFCSEQEAQAAGWRRSLR